MPAAEMTQKIKWRALPEVRVAFLGGLLNLIWEFAQSPLYVTRAPTVALYVWYRVHCAGGDVLILLGSFYLVALIMSDRRWIYRCSVAAVALFIGSGLAYTIYSEWLNTRVLDGWRYSEAMPRIGGIGLTPLLQWVIIPSAVLYLARRGHARKAE